MKLIYATLIWLCGVIFEYFLDTSIPFGPLMVASAVGFGLTWPHDRVRYIRILLVSISLFALGAWRFGQVEHPSDALVPLQNTGTVSIDGIVTREPDERDTGTLLRVEVDRVLWLGAWQSFTGTVQVRVGADEVVEFGDRLVATGMLRPAPVLDTFSYSDYLSRRGINSVMSPESVVVTGHDAGSPVRGAFIMLKQRAEQTIEQNLPEPQSSLLSGILLGDDKDMPPDVRDAFNVTGTSHIIAISGFNMVIIAAALRRLLEAFTDNGWLIFLLSMLALTIYTIFVGANPPVVRATVMSGVLVFGQTVVRRSTFVPASLAFVVMMMGLMDPWTLWDVGFQLSFAAVLGMMLFVQPIEHGFRDAVSNRFGKNTAIVLTRALSEPLFVGIAAQVFVLPIILFYFGRLSILTIPVNMVIVPVQPYVLGFGIVATLTGMLIPSAGYIAFAAVWLVQGWTLFWVRWAGQWSSTVTEYSISSTVLGVAVIVAATGTFMEAMNPRWFRTVLQSGRFWTRVISVIIIAALLSTMFQLITGQPNGKLQVIFLDAGLSNSVLIESPDGAVFLIDGGRYPSRLLQALGDTLPAQKREIDVLFITHDDNDDIGALNEVIQRYQVRVAITAVQNSNEQQYVELIADMEATGTVIIEAADGNRIHTGDGVSIDILSPNQYVESGNDMVLRMVYGESVFLFTHEMEVAHELLLMQSPHQVQATVLQIARHAQENSSSNLWLQTVNPEIAVLQNDPAAFDSAVDSRVLDRFQGIQLLRTDHDGTITIISDGQQLNIRTSEEPN